jgi:hypothetical protein
LQIGGDLSSSTLALVGYYSNEVLIACSGYFNVAELRRFFLLEIVTLSGQCLVFGIVLKLGNYVIFEGVGSGLIWHFCGLKSGFIWKFKVVNYGLIWLFSGFKFR